MKIFSLLIILSIPFISVFAQTNSPMIVATYNLRQNNPNDGVNVWPNRKEMVKGLIRFHEFDIFGTQEGFIGQLNDLLEIKEFAYTGHGRDDGKEAGEHSAIFYKKDRFKLLKEGDFWLSETPGQPSFGWDAKGHRRICSWAKFKDLQSEKEFYLFNAHFDNRGIQARIESGKLMVKKIREIAGEYPVFCVGDFNSTPETEQIKNMQTILRDSRQISATPPYGPIGTTNSFNFDAPMDKLIDYIFVSKQIDILKYGVLTDSKEQRYPSDHQPVVVKAVIN
ncbi:MAG: endonuclease [Bacteroidetes bacterium GWF2_42_66]|nr:MAG: endonuclease [Bacteroidetes bacterium GWA2_42_15]OFY01921.1 MAG: endonuclease [Bacteroidetes bacterium GWE2_42_39]OFY44783.1 MAG: endonuclease [Bacteroidetes bacterium GWF2_42_66]HBL75909.1 endonuclease [Prolixibacteraceae bacterium]HCR89155.1 endonuclease [Prolixibacteraceae bacterium]